MPPLWSDNFSATNIAEVLRLDDENRVWHKTLRLQAAALVDSRLAKQISQEEYAVRRQVAIDDVAECKRRGRILVNEIYSRGTAQRKTGVDVAVARLVANTKA